MSDANGQSVIATGVAPPHSLDAELSVLGGILLSDKALRPIVDEEGLRPGHFYRERHRLIFQAMCDMFEAAERPDEHVVDVLTLTEFLREKGQLEEVGGKAAVDELTGGVPGLGGIRKYAQIVKLHAEKRQTLSAAYEIQAGILNHDDEQVERGRRALDQLVLPAPGQAHLVEAADFSDHMWKFLTAKREPGFPLPWPGLNRTLSLLRGHGTVFSGWTSVGKSQASFQLLAHIGRKVPTARCVAIITEMTPEEHGSRQLVRDTAIPYDTFMDGDINSAKNIDHARLVRALKEMPFGCIGAHGDSVDTICRLIRQIRADVVLLDHFHAIPDVSRSEDASNAVAKLLAAAAMANCHLIIVAQLNRGRDDTNKKPPPTLRDLRSTAALEQLPSNVVFVHRESVEIPTDDGTDDATPKYEFGDTGYLHVAKQRGGQTGIVPVTWVPDRLYFLERERSAW